MLLRALARSLSPRFGPRRAYAAIHAGPQRELPESFVKAHVLEVEDQPGNVRIVRLEVDPCHSGRFSFSPGQWVDFYIPEIDRVTGYSMTSSPLELPHLELAVKKSGVDICAQWVHAASKGSETWLRPGGSVVFDPLVEQRANPLLVAGGVGITPFLSMLAHLTRVDAYEGSAALVHTCRGPMFSDRLALLKRDPRVSILQNITDGTDPIKRLGTDDLQRAMDHLACKNNVVVPYVCGPEGFVDHATSILAQVGIPEKEIRIERWW